MVSEHGGGVRHWPVSSSRVFCGAVIGDREDVVIEDAAMQPDGELCSRCTKLFNEDAWQRLRQVYALALEAARERRQSPAPIHRLLAGLEGDTPMADRG